MNKDQKCDWVEQNVRVELTSGLKTECEQVQVVKVGTAAGTPSA